MTHKQAQRLLLDSGFALLRKGRKHEIWVKGELRIPLSHGNKRSHHSIKQLEIYSKRAKISEAV